MTLESEHLLMPTTHDRSGQAYLSNLYWMFFFKDSKLSQKYTLFKLASSPSWVVFWFAILITISFIAYWALMFNDGMKSFSIILCVLSFLFSICCLWILVFLRMKLSLTLQQTRYSRHLFFLEAIIAYGTITILGMLLIMKSLVPCDSFNFLETWDCSADIHCHTIPTELGLMIILLPLIFKIVFPHLTPIANFLGLALAMVFIYTTIGLSHAYLSIGWTTVQCFVVICLILLYRIQNLHLFLLLTNYYENVEEATTKQHEDMRRLTKEIRTLISYISHDLKTVSLVLFSHFHVNA